MSVRSDGNNFIAEIAAVSCAIKALPSNVQCTFYIDSMAAIGAISKGLVSERKRIRASGRAWLNYCQKEFLQKKPKIKICHISSHKGTKTPEQKGNDIADNLANSFRMLVECHAPVKYFMDGEEKFHFNDNGYVIQGDPRSHFKKLEQKILQSNWFKKAPKQASWFKKHPTQILNQAKRVWKSY